MSMQDEKFTTRVIHGLRVSRRVGDGRCYCKNCGIALDVKGGCSSCKQVKGAWRTARVEHYARTRTPETLAQMLVELEDRHDVCPEFSIDEKWPG